ncbi:MAG TPA: hypothetical protein VIC08_10970 [Cellvibrionaceae bacterium]
MGFSSTIDKWVAGSEARMEAVQKTSAQDLVAEVSKSRDKGGNMPVDTSNLVNSLHGNVGSMPRGESDGNERFQAGNIALAINRWNPGEVLYLGWTAEYAKLMEALYAFMKLAAQNWDGIAMKATKKVKSMVGV